MITNCDLKESVRPEHVEGSNGVIASVAKQSHLLLLSLIPSPSIGGERVKGEGVHFCNLSFPNVLIGNLVFNCLVSS